MAIGTPTPTILTFAWPLVDWSFHASNITHAILSVRAHTQPSWRNLQPALPRFYNQPRHLWTRFPVLNLRFSIWWPYLRSYPHLHRNERRTGAYFWSVTMPHYSKRLSALKANCLPLKFSSSFSVPFDRTTQHTRSSGNITPASTRKTTYQGHLEYVSYLLICFSQPSWSNLIS